MIVVLTGPTCAGKSTVEAELQRMGFGRAVSHTTRAPRAGEVDGREYHFIHPFDFHSLNQAGEFIETIEFDGTLYAMSATSVKKAMTESENGHIVIVAEPVGADQILVWGADNGIEVFPVYVDCDRQVQADRFIARVAANAAAGKDLSADAKRLTSMMTTETKWHEFRAYCSLLIGHGQTQSPRFWASLIASHVVSAPTA